MALLSNTVALLLPAALRLVSSNRLAWLTKLKSTRIFFYSFDDVETKSQNAFFYAEVLRA